MDSYPKLINKNTLDYQLFQAIMSCCQSHNQGNNAINKLRNMKIFLTRSKSVKSKDKEMNKESKEEMKPMILGRTA